MIKIEIIGPGLVINRPVALIFEALIKAGYEVDLAEFDGQYQYIAKEDWPKKEIESAYQKGMKIQMDVEACPWGA